LHHFRACRIVAPISHERGKPPRLPAALLAAKASIDLTVRLTCRPLVVGGKFDRAAIMSAAAKAARLHQERFGCTSREAMLVALKVAKLARHTAAH
jgi:hypothetical protein